MDRRALGKILKEKVGENKRSVFLHNFRDMSKMVPVVLDFLCESEHNVSIFKNTSFSFHLTLPTDKITRGINGIILIS